ncbi:hypothetical protein TsFJ059_002907 [Trichoderma semiorbis]|uniref:Uncharacterized protein n=1 Tax=Trichoderma semiorbis TaxID=1491008 RepID=A0A9P8KTG1_9HYPO|nr:hypothetical protein TsFJ059_002907 [Trichoderma semiorbis]
MSDLVNNKDDGSSILTIQSVEHHPKADKFFMIREKQKPHRIITLFFGDLVLVEDQFAAQGWLWKCVKKSGWYGFQNMVSGAYLGYKGQSKKLQAVMPHHKNNEYFMAERHEDGGYVLLTIHGEELWQVAISEDGKSLVEKKAEEGAGTAWDFVEIGKAHAVS